MIMTSTTLLGRMQTEFLHKLLLPIFQKETTSPQKNSTQNPFTPKSPTKTSKTKCFKCLSFGYIAANYPNKRTIKLHEVKTRPP